MICLEKHHLGGFIRLPIDDVEVEMLKADLEKLADHTLTGNEAYEVLRLLEMRR